MVRARIGRAAIERGAALRAASRRSPELKSPSPKRPQRSRAGTAKAEVDTVEESVESSTKQLAGSRTAPAASKNSKASGKATAAKDMGPRKLAPLRGSVVEESAGGSPSVPVRRSRAASVRARSVVEEGSMAKAPPRASALDKGKGKQKQAERLGKGKGKLVEVIEESDGVSAEDEERAAESAVPTEIVDESENTVNISDKKADEEKAEEPKDSEDDEVLDPSKIIPIMNTLVKEDIADLGMIHQLQNSVTRLTEEANNILCACRKETAFRTRLEAYLRYCVFNNNLDSKNGWVTIQEKGRLDNGWTAEEMWSGGGVLVVYGPDFQQLATETEEDELFWVLDDEEIQESIDRELPSDDEESEGSGETAGGKEGEEGEEGEEGDGEDMSGDEENGSDAEPASQPSSPSRKRPRDDNEEIVTPPARRIKV